MTVTGRLPVPVTLPRLGLNRSTSMSPVLRTRLCLQLVRGETLMISVPLWPTSRASRVGESVPHPCANCVYLRVTSYMISVMRTTMRMTPPRVNLGRCLRNMGSVPCGGTVTTVGWGVWGQGGGLSVVRVVVWACFG